jgi:hypothetical protein
MVKLSLCRSLSDMGGVEVELHLFIAALDWGEWSALCPGRFAPEGGFVGPRVGPVA